MVSHRWIFFFQQTNHEGTHGYNINTTRLDRTCSPRSFTTILLDFYTRMVRIKDLVHYNG